jgi:hypothetical protein
MSTVPDEVISRLTVEELSALVSGLNGVLRVVHLLESDAAG